MKHYVAYYCASTRKQGQYGLDSRRRTVELYCQQGCILEEFTDIKSGKNNERPW